MCGKGASFPFLPLSDLAMGLECAEKEEVNCKGKREEGGDANIYYPAVEEEERKLRKRNNLRPFKRNYRGKEGEEGEQTPLPPPKKNIIVHFDLTPNKEKKRK